MNNVALKEIPIWEPPRNPIRKIEVTITIPETDHPKLLAWMSSDTFEKAEAIRNAKHSEWIESLEYVVKYAHQEFGSAAHVFASFLASLYNGNRVKADVSGIGSLDSCNFEHLMNVMRLCFSTHQEPHSFFKDGNDVFEYIIKRHKLERRRKS